MNNPQATEDETNELAALDSLDLIAAFLPQNWLIRRRVQTGELAASLEARTARKH
jgi:hypothetical protein